MKININDFFPLNDYWYNDFENIKCAKQSIKGIHDELHPSMYSYQQQKKQINYNHQLIDELDKINYELHNDLCIEKYRRICQVLWKSI